MENTKSRLELLAEKLREKVHEMRVPVAACLLFALAAYMFVFTNKLLNLDEIAGLFGKGETFTSGRWALRLTSFFFPDYSMPWINGLLSVFLLTTAVCLVIDVFEIQSRMEQILLAGLLMTFPSQTLTYTYMFTCAPYALALLLAVASVYLTLQGGKGRFALGIVCLCLSLGIYQAYLSVTASLYVVYCIKMTIDGEKESKDVVKCGILCVVSLILSLAAYFIVNKLVMRFAAAEYNSYAEAAWNTDIKSLLSGLRVAFTAFFGYFYKGYYHLVPTKFSMLLHIASLVLIAMPLTQWLFRCKDTGRRVLLIALLFLFPFSVNCIYIISAQRHTLMLTSFTSVYVLAALVWEMTDRKKLRSALAGCLALMIVCNIFYANRLYLKMKLEYEEAYSFYTGLITRVKSTEGYDADTMLILSGDAGNLVYHADEIDTSDLVGVMEGLLNIYSRYDFLRYYVGYDYNPIDWDGWAALDKADEVAKMPLYPYDGSVRKFGDYMVVKLS